MIWLTHNLWIWAAEEWWCPKCATRTFYLWTETCNCKLQAAGCQDGIYVLRCWPRLPETTAAEGSLSLLSFLVSHPLEQRHGFRLAHVYLICRRHAGTGLGSRRQANWKKQRVVDGDGWIAWQAHRSFIYPYRCQLGLGRVQNSNCSE